MDSDDDLRRHCLDDVARPLTCQIVFIPSKRCVPVVVAIRPRRSVRLAGDVALPCCSRRWDGRMVAGGNDFGGGGDEAEVVGDGGRERKCLFVYILYVSFRQTPLTRLSIKRRWSLSHNITNLSQRAPFIY